MNSRIVLRANNGLRVAFSTVIGVLLFANLVTIEYFASSIYTSIQYVFLLLILSYVFRKIYKVRKSDWCFILLIFVMGGLIVISSYVGNVVGYNLRASIYYATFTGVMCLFLIEARRVEKLKEVLIGGKLYLIVVLALTDMLMIVLPSKFYNISGRDIGTTLLGNKFNVAYAHLMLMFLSIFLEERLHVRNKKVIIYAIIVAGICKFCDCTTALLGCCLFVFLYFVPLKIKEVLSRPIVVMLLFFLSAFLLLAFDGILMSKPIQYLIVEVLHRDGTLTGRMQVYPYVLMLIADKPWFGYGYGTDIVKRVSIWYANAQNGLLDFAIRYGWLASAALTFNVFVATAKNSKNNKHNIDGKNWLTLIMIYVYIFMGIAEITYGKVFFFYIILLYACSCLRSVNKKKQCII